MATASTLANEPSLDLTVPSLARRRTRWRMEEESTEPAMEAPAIVIVPVAITLASRWQHCFPHTVGFLSSTAAHLIIFLGAALVGIAVQAERSLPLEVTAEVIEMAALEEIVSSELPELMPEIISTATPSVEFSALEDDPGQSDGGQTKIELFTFAATQPIGDPAHAPGTGSEAGNGSGSSGAGAGGEAGAGEEETGTEFFGVQAQGKRFVFVCDCSRSMSGQKWMELQRELARCIGELGPEKSFYIVFFDGEMHPMFAPSFHQEGLLPAIEENVEKAQLWLSSIILGPNTEPFESMKFAAAFEPDAIFFLTDGEFSDYTAPYMRDFNKKRKANDQKMVAVHTIGFFSNKGRVVLERIAKDSGGTYKFIAEPHVPKPKRRSWNVYAPAPGARMVPGFVAPVGRPVNDG